MTKYLDYIRGGEILLAPSLQYEEQYTLKCYECKEFYDQLEAFVTHCFGHINFSKDLDKWSQSEMRNNAKEEEDAKEKIIKFEVEADHVEVDPLNSLDLDENCASSSKHNSSKMYESDFENESPNDEDYEFEEEPTDAAEDSSSDNMDLNNESIKKKRIKSESFVRKFTKSKENMSAFIKAYKRQPKLWNRTITHIGTQERHRVLQEIIKELKSQMNMSLSYAQVSAVITHLRYTFKVKLKGRQKKQNVAKQWYLEELEFLRPFVESNLGSTLDSFQPELSGENLIQVLNIYQGHPVLWDSDLIENCCENKREEALNSMINVIQSQMGLTVKPNTLKGYLEAIREYITKEKYNRLSSKTSKVRSEYYNVMQFLHDHVGPFKCNECERKLKNPLLFKIHKSEHDGTIPLKCSLCKKEFKVIGSYTDHARRHMKDLKEKCEQCGKRFLNAYNLMIHMRSHTGANPFCCEICGTSFRHIQSYATHKRRHEKKYLHNCPVCSKGFYKKVELNDHLRSHYNVRDFVCKTCGKAFKTRKTLAQHVVIHDDARKHACNICGKTFKLKIGVSQHMKTHGNSFEKSVITGPD